MVTNHESPRVQTPPSKSTAEPENIGLTSNTNPKKLRPRRPNYNVIHAKPLPLDTHPLPAFIPHNPISILRIAITVLSQSFWPPKSHQNVHAAHFSLETQSVHVTDPKSIRALWEQGFWGSGSLSRSEPHWLDQEKRKRGLEAIATSEEWTRQQREKRRQFKLERAREQRAAIEEQLRQEGKPGADTDVDGLIEEGSITESPKGTLYPADSGIPVGGIAIGNGNLVAEHENNTLASEIPPEPEIINQEHLQLTAEEAFFLHYALGALDIYHDNTLLHPVYLLRMFCAYSEFPLKHSLVDSIPPDDSFLLNYVVFHHFRSLGWVVRSGVKFACDFLLYLRGPTFNHAEFAIMIIPSYSHSYWTETTERAAACKAKARRDWWWLHRLNRVQTQAKKTLMLVYVEVPPPWDQDCKDKDLLDLDIGNVLSRYKVREFIWKRWSPNRNRD